MREVPLCCLHHGRHACTPSEAVPEHPLPIPPLPLSRLLPVSSTPCQWPFYRTISGVRLCWELEEPEGPKGSRPADAAVTFSCKSFRDRGGAHVGMCVFHPAFWHSDPQWEACLQTEQRLSALRCLPQWAQRGALEAIPALAVVSPCLFSPRMCELVLLMRTRTLDPWAVGSDRPTTAKRVGATLHPSTQLRNTLSVVGDLRLPPDLPPQGKIPSLLPR